MKKHIPKKWLYAITALWLMVLVSMSFIFEVSQTTLLMTYVTGQGFVIALWVPYWSKFARCKKVK
ncbi:hypothetical protein [Nonlabens spongiae]|uniref:hypothetical protein n=1 Tax=Nonlabens spongiae TaxID=331648 RepID=UPI0012F482CD|nr:hypothetical protein [Nonlabens spongiae]